MRHRTFPRSYAFPRAPRIHGARRLRLRRALAALITTGVALGGVSAAAAPAHGGRRTLVDQPNDVLKQVGHKPPKLAPKNRTADVTTFVTRLTNDNLTLSTTVRKLPKNYWAMLWQVKTDSGARYAVDLLKTGDLKFELSLDDVPIVCTMEKSVNPVKGKVTVVVPLACIGSPSWVRTGAGAAATDRDFGRIFTDDANLIGEYKGSHLELGNTVKRN